MRSIAVTTDRVGCPRNDDRRVAQVCSPDFDAEEVNTRNRSRLRTCRSYGTLRTISTGPWKSRTEREIPTFPQADSSFCVMRRTKMDRPQTGSLSERRTGLQLSERCLQSSGMSWFAGCVVLCALRGWSSLRPPRMMFSAHPRMVFSAASADDATQVASLRLLVPVRAVLRDLCGR